MSMSLSSVLARVAVPSALAALLLIACDSPAGAQSKAAAPTAGWLLGRMATQAKAEARSATRHGRTAEAATWNGWAGVYQGLAANPGAARLSAAQFAAAMVRQSRSQRDGAERVKATAAAAFYGAMLGFWTGQLNQLGAGHGAVIHFPRQAMLRAVPGLPESPWASRPASAALQKLVLCNGLATRKTQCENRLAELQHEQRLGIGDHGDEIVVQMTMCHRIEESWVKSCAAP